MAGVVIRVAVVTLIAVTAATTMAAPVSAQDDPRRGREVFEQSCAMCHGQDASGMMGMHPSLRGAIERLSRAGVDVTIREGRSTTPPMPSFGNQLTDEEIGDVVAYLDTLPVGPRNFGSGGDDGMMDGMMDGGDVVVAVVVGSVPRIRCSNRCRLGPGDSKSLVTRGWETAG